MPDQNDILVPLTDVDLAVTDEEAAANLCQVIDEQMTKIAKALEKEFIINSRENTTKGEPEMTETFVQPTDEMTTTVVVVEEETPIELTQDQLDKLPKTKYGHDKYGNILKKDGTARKPRSDAGQARGTYKKKDIAT